jgi:hypothetical protein
MRPCPPSAGWELRCTTNAASAQDLAALRAAVLRCHEHFMRMEPPIPSLLMVRRLKRLHLSWLMIPWFVVLVVRSFLPRHWRESFADEEQAVRLYRRLSGKDPGGGAGRGGADRQPARAA